MRFALPLTATALLLAAALPASAAISTGAPAPAFSLGSSLGKPVALADLKGQVVLVNFWASWCGPCRTEMPILDQVYRKYKALGVTLVGINVEPNSTDAQKYLQSVPVSFPILFDTDSTVSKLYQVEGMPNTVIVDRKGVVRYIHHGYTAGAENEYMDQLRALIREK
ncbi:MAG TPA: TlpA disulfide reductase family protein [Steroidobacteraceae bacterium]|nr:TlpA disulfide reductase family protein [Steroidobacteraceae bacterium]